MTWACPQDIDTPDPSEWGARNRVQLYPGRVQTWVLARAVDRDKPGDEELRKMARAVMGRWFSDSSITDMPGRSGHADELTIGRPSEEPPPLPVVLQHWTKLPGPVPLLKPGRILYVPVQFVWRSQSETWRPWPTYRVNWGFGGPCPVEADWMLLEVGGPSAQLPEAGPEQSIPERVSEVVGDALSPPAWLGLTLAALAAGYLINAVRR